MEQLTKESTYERPSCCCVRYLRLNPSSRIDEVMSLIVMKFLTSIPVETKTSSAWTRFRSRGPPPPH